MRVSQRSLPKKRKVGRAKKRGLREKIGDAVDATKYVAEDVGRKMRGEPTQREQKDAAKAKVGRMNAMKDAGMKRGGKKLKLKEKKQ